MGGFTNEFQSVNNSINKNDKSSYFWLFFIPSFSTVILLIYIDGIFPSVFTNGYQWIPMDIARAYSIGKIHYNLPTEKLC